MITKFTPAFAESKRVDVSTLRPEDVVGVGHALAEIDALVIRLREPERAIAMGLRPPRGILFHGAPGLGKTTCARYLAARLGTDVMLFEASADELSPDRIRGLLAYLAEHHPRSVLYLDEIDGIGMSRDYGGHDTGSRDRLIALLGALSGLRDTSGPVVIASSNRPPHHLDPALVRAGRLGTKIRFDGPDEDERVALWMMFTRDVPAESGIDWRHAARLTRDKTPADLRQMAEDAASIALGAGRVAISADDVVNAIRRDGRVEPEAAAAGEVRHRMAIHESGHCCVALSLRGRQWLYATRLGINEGRTSVGDESVPDSMAPDDERRDAMTVAFGGIAAERALLGEGSTGGTSDVSRASAIGLERIAAGLSDDITPIDLDLLGRNVSEGLKAQVAADLAVQIESARTIATAIVAANVDAIGRFAAVLEAAGELTGDALTAAVSQARFLDSHAS